MDLTNNPIDLKQLIKQLTLINKNKTENNKAFKATVSVKTEKKIENLIDFLLITIKNKKYIIEIAKSEDEK